MGQERIPAHFRPSNQANMVAAEPLNPSASQSMMPGLGMVRSGNEVTDNGLAPLENAEIHKQIIAQDKQTRAKKLQGALTKIGQEMAQITADLDQLKTKGDRANTAVLRRKAAKLEQLKAKAERIKEAITIIKTGKPTGGYRNRPLPTARHNLLEPWKRPAKWKRKDKWVGRDGHRFKQVPEAVPLSHVYAPPTPDPLVFEPGAKAPGLSQQERAKILAMQANIQPVQSMDGITEIMDTAKEWAAGELIPGVPNWAIAAGGAGLVGLILLKRK